jgi:hypothetical protein
MFFSLHPHKIVLAVVPLFATGVVASCRRFIAGMRCPAAKGRAAVCLTMFAMAVGCGNYVALRDYFFGDGLREELTVEFSNPRLRHIRSTPERVKAVDGVMAHLSGKLRRGDFLVAYDYIPLFYYLTGTRPGVNAAWLPRRSGPRVRKSSLRYMIDNGRVPAYCIRALRRWGVGPLRYSKDPSRDPVSAFVEENYELDAVFPPFEVWKLKEGWRRPESEIMTVPD